VAQQGGEVAHTARVALEQRTGQKVVSELSAEQLRIGKEKS